MSVDVTFQFHPDIRIFCLTNESVAHSSLFLKEKQDNDFETNFYDHGLLFKKAYSVGLLGWGGKFL